MRARSGSPVNSIFYLLFPPQLATAKNFSLQPARSAPYSPKFAIKGTSTINILSLTKTIAFREVLIKVSSLDPPTVLKKSPPKGPLGGKYRHHRSFAAKGQGQKLFAAIKSRSVAAQG